MRLDPAKTESQQQQQKQPDRESDAHRQGAHGARRSFPVHQQVIEGRSETADNYEEHQHYKNFHVRILRQSGQSAGMDGIEGAGAP